jgi:FkbM family methyltransferase
MNEYIKHLLIRTPLEKPAKTLQSLLKYKQRLRHPELEEIYLESERIEQIMKREISNSSNCIDIGAHLGSMLSEILNLSPKGRHMAFEPTPQKARWLKQKFTGVDIKEIALSDTTGKVSFYIDKYRSGFSGLRKHRKGDDLVTEVEVRCDRIDNVLDPEHKVDFMKIDVEGGELAVLRGAANTLFKYHPLLLFECCRSGLSAFGFTSKQVFEFLTQHSYSIYLLKDFLADGRALSSEQFDRALHYPFKGFNFIAKYSNR